MSYQTVADHIDDNHSHHGNAVVAELKAIAKRNATPISWAELVTAIDIAARNWETYVNMKSLEEIAGHYGKQWKSKHGATWVAIIVGPELIHQISKAFNK